MSVHKNWIEVLASIKRDLISDNLYLLVVNKGTNDEKRSRFLTRTEALELVIYEIEKSRNEKL